MAINWNQQIGLMSKRSRKLLALASVLPLLLFLLWVASLDGWSVGDFGLLAIAIPYVAIMTRLVHVGVDFSERGLVVQNFFRTRTYPWGEIDRFDAESPGYSMRSAAASFVTADGKRHALTAVQDYNLNVLVGRTDTPAARSIDDLNRLLDHIKRDGFDPNTDYFAALQAPSVLARRPV